MKLARCTATLSLAIGLLLTSPWSAAAPSSDNLPRSAAAPRNFRSGELLVVFRDDSQVQVATGNLLTSSDVTLQNLFQRYQAQWGKRWTQSRALSERAFARYATMPEETQQRFRERGAFLAKVTRIMVNRTDIEAVAAEFRQNPAVDVAEPNYVYHSQLSPNDPFLSSKGSWGQSYDDLWGIKKIAAPAAWDKTQGEGVLVAVVDSGVDRNHPDLAANIWINGKEVAGNGKDDDGNGKIDDVYGWNFVDDNNDTMDRLGHGTHCAGIIAAVGNNSVGVIGVAPKAKILPVKALSDGGSGSLDQLAQAVRYAADMGADVISNSWGGLGYSQILREAMAYAHDLGAVVVVAAGNDASDIEYFSPAGAPKAITVAASGPTDARAVVTLSNGLPYTFSNFGARIDVAAPGEDILSLKAANASLATERPNFVVNNDYLRLSGTSMATPHVAGVAALILAKNPAYSPEQVRWVLRKTADDVLTAGWDLFSGYGRVNAQKAVNNSTAPPATFADIATPAPVQTGRTDTGGNQVRGSINVTGTANGTGFSGYKLYYAKLDTADSAVTFTQAKSASVAVTNGTLSSWDTSSLSDGRYLLRLAVTGAGGAVNESHALIYKDGTLKAGWPKMVNPAFTVPATWPISADARTPVLVDLDGDGKKEVLVLSSDNYEFYADKIQGYKFDGTALTGFPLSLPGILQGQTVTTGDLDNDGKQDLAMVLMPADNNAAFKPLHVYGHDGKLRSGFPVMLPVSSDEQFSNEFENPVVIADVDGDGVNDLVVVWAGFKTQVWEPYNTAYVGVFNRNGTIKPGWPKSLGFGRATALTVGDLDGDGKLEIVFGLRNLRDNQRKLFILEHDGRLRREITPPAKDTLHYWEVESIVLADVDNDGRPEILVRQPGSNDSVDIYLLNSNGDTLSGWPVNVNFAGPGNFVDVDGDGFLDYLVSGSANGNEPQHLFAFKRDGSTITGFPKQVLTGGAFFQYWDATGNKRQTYGTALNSPQAATVSKLNKAPNGALFIPTTVDWELPIHPDSKTGIYGFAANGDVLANWPKRIPTSLGAVAIADLDGDGSMELAVQSLDGQVYIWSEAAPTGTQPSFASFQGNNQRTSQHPIFICREWTNTIADHMTANRAYSKLSGFTTTYYAVGSNTNLGTSRTASVKLAESKPGYFIQGACPPPPTAPVVATLNVAVSGANATVSGTASDVNNDLQSVEVALDGAGWVVANGTSNWSLSLNNLATGSHSVAVRAIDAGGRISAVKTASFSTSSASACVTAKNTVHISDGRAHPCGTSFSPKACANGSNDDLGSSSSYAPATTSIKQTGSNYWMKVASCN